MRKYIGNCQNGRFSWKIYRYIGRHETAPRKQRKKYVEKLSDELPILTIHIPKKIADISGKIDIEYFLGKFDRYIDRH